MAGNPKGTPDAPRVARAHAPPNRAPTGNELSLRAARLLVLAQAGEPEKFAEWLDLRREMGDSMEAAIEGLAPDTRPALARWCFQAGLQDLGMLAFRASATRDGATFDNAEVIEYFRQVELASGLLGVVDAADELLESGCHDLALRTSVHALTLLGDHEGAQNRLERYGDPSATMAARALTAKDVLALVAAKTAAAAAPPPPRAARRATPRAQVAVAAPAAVAPPAARPAPPAAIAPAPPAPLAPAAAALRPPSPIVVPAAPPAMRRPVRAVTGPPSPVAEPRSAAPPTRPLPSPGAAVASAAHANEIKILTGEGESVRRAKPTRRTLSPSSHPLIGRQIDGGFTLTSFLSEGRIAQVFTARSDAIAEVAVKVLLPSFAADLNVTKRFLRSAQKSNRLRHESIAPVYAAGEDEGLFYVVSELLRGENLDSCIERRGALSEMEAVKFTLQVGAALESALSLGVVHRGISPSNVMITRDVESPDLEGAKVTDFGMADVVLTRRPLSGYVAPERVTGEAGDPRADVYSLGAMLFHLLTGQVPFGDQHYDGLANAIVHHPAEYPRAAPAIQPKLKAIIERALQKEPAARYANARALDDELRAVREVLESQGATKRLASNPSQPSIAADEAGVPRARARHPLIDTLLGDRFRVSGLMRAGGMAQLFAGMDTKTSHSVAIKVMHPALAAEPEIAKRFGREARLAERLKHPNIVEFRHVCDDPPHLFIAMELLAGEDLSIRLKQRGRVPERQAAEIALDVCSALAYAHRLGVVHRDIKPANVMLCGGGGGGEVVKLLDFGIAKVLEGHTSATRPGLTLAKSAITIEGDLVGTPKYMSPEQGTASAIDHRTDLYALGVVLYELVTGTVPFTGSTHLQILARHVQDRPLPPRDLIHDLDPDFEALILHLLEKIPAHRPQSASEVIERLTIILPQLSASTATSTSRWLDREPRTVAMAALLPPTLVEEPIAVVEDTTTEDAKNERAEPSPAPRERPQLDPRPVDDEVTRAVVLARRLQPRTLASEAGAAAAVVAAAEATPAESAAQPSTLPAPPATPAPSAASVAGVPIGPVRTQKMDVQQILAYARAHRAEHEHPIEHPPETARDSGIIRREDGPTASLLATPQPLQQPASTHQPTSSQQPAHQGHSAASWGAAPAPPARDALEAQVAKLHRLVMVLTIVVVLAISCALALAFLR